MDNRLIQWFPGHMAKAIRQTEEDLKLCDGVIYVLDARAPYACFNKKLSAIFKNKPVVYCVNKIDTVSTASLSIISEQLKNAGLTFCLTDGLSKKDTAKLKAACENVMRTRIERDRTKGIKRALRFMVAGIPNTGKSTIINTVSGGKHAQTGDKAGVTRANKWIKMGDFELLDTPGTTSPSFENQTYAKHLAYIGSLNDDVLDIEGLALELIKELTVIAPEKLKEKYSLESLDVEPLAIYDAICKRRGFLLRGGESDYTRCARAVIDDFRKQRIGKICLEEKWN